jgi:hypothetical protein
MFALPSVCLFDLLLFYLCFAMLAKVLSSLQTPAYLSYLLPHPCIRVICTLSLNSSHLYLSISAFVLSLLHHPSIPRTCTSLSLQVLQYLLFLWECRGETEIWALSKYGIWTMRNKRTDPAVPRKPQTTLRLTPPDGAVQPPWFLTHSFAIELRLWCDAPDICPGSAE